MFSNLFNFVSMCLRIALTAMRLCFCLFFGVRISHGNRSMERFSAVVQFYKSWSVKWLSSLLILFTMMLTYSFIGIFVLHTQGQICHGYACTLFYGCHNDNAQVEKVHSFVFSLS